MSISPPHSNRSGILCNSLSYSPSNIHNSNDDSVQYLFIAGGTSAEKLSTIVVGNLGLPLLPISLDSHQSKYNKMKSCTDPTFSLP